MLLRKKKKVQETHVILTKRPDNMSYEDYRKALKSQQMREKTKRKATSNIGTSKYIPNTSKEGVLFKEIDELV